MTVFVLQAIPWLIIFGLWTLLSLAAIALVVLPVKLVAVILSRAARAIETLIGAALGVLIALRPVPPRRGPQDPTATAPTTEGGVA